MGINVDLLGLRSLEAKPRGDRVLEAALHYAKNGARVVPQYPNSKVPAIDDWKNGASNDPAVIKRWFGPEGPFHNANLAILIDGFTVIDVDVHGDKNGFKTLAGALDGIPCPRAMTAGEGEHLLASVTDVKEAEGVEVLKDGKMFTVYPSEINGKRYLWKTGGAPSPVKRIREAARTPSAPGATALAPAPYVRELLEHIDPDADYGTWLRVGMAIHHNDAGHAGLKLWDEWSQLGRKYKPDECERRWGTFDANRGKPATMRWLIVEAIKNGRKPTKEDILYHGNLFNSLEIERLNEKYGIHDLGGKMYIVYEEFGQVYFSDAANFRLKIADQKCEVDGKLKPLADVWLEHPDRRIISQVGMWELQRAPEGALNYYKGLAVEPVPCEESDIKMFLDFCRDDICRGNARHYEYLMDMLAAKLQKPLRLMKIALIMRGGEGTGKGALTRVMENIIGPMHSVRVSSANSWLGTYGTMLKSAIWLSANEAYWSGNHSQSERLKALITEEEIDIEEKYINIKKYKNRVMIAVTTNNSWAVPAGHDSRRYFVLDVSNNRADDPAFWDEFHARLGTNDDGELCDPEYLGKVLYWFLQRKVTADLKRAMETEWLVQQRKESAQESREEMFVFWVRNAFTGDVPNDLITAPGGYTFMRCERTDGSAAFRADRVYEDYRTWVGKNTRKPRMTYDQGTFNVHMGLLGMTATRVKKASLTIGGRKMPNEGAADTKISVMALPTPDDIEAGITQHFGLFANPTEKEDVDSDR